MSDIRRDKRERRERIRDRKSEIRRQKFSCGSGFQPRSCDFYEFNDFYEFSNSRINMKR